LNHWLSPTHHLAIDRSLLMLVCCCLCCSCLKGSSLQSFLFFCPFALVGPLLNATEWHQLHFNRLSIDRVSSWAFCSTPRHIIAVVAPLEPSRTPRFPPSRSHLSSVAITALFGSMQAQTPDFICVGICLLSLTNEVSLWLLRHLAIRLWVTIPANRCCVILAKFQKFCRSAGADSACELFAMTCCSGDILKMSKMTGAEKELEL